MEIEILTTLDVDADGVFCGECDELHFGTNSCRQFGVGLEIWMNDEGFDCIRCKDCKKAEERVNLLKAKAGVITEYNDNWTIKTEQPFDDDYPILYK